MSNPQKPTDAGRNRTGIATSPIHSKQMIDGARAGTPQPRSDGRELLAARIAFSSEAPPLGTVPPPLSVKGVAKSAVDMLKGKNPLIFVDLLAERLAFERTGTRLYDALLAKYDAAHMAPGRPAREELVQIRDEELEHFGLVKQAIESLGGDPTAMTPSANVTAVMSMGLVQALSDPRVTFTEALKAILVAELADNDGWSTLADVAERLGHDELAEQFQRALAEEEQHLVRVRAWLTASIEGQAGLEPSARGAEGEAAHD